MTTRLSMSAGFLFSSLLLCGPVLQAGQSTPPIGGVTGTLALDGTVDDEYKAGNTVIVKTVDGIKHLFHLTDRTAVHGADDLAGIEKGSVVIVHYVTVAGQDTAVEVDRVGDKGLKTIEAVVTRVDREAKTIYIRLADGSTQALRLTDRAASDVGKDIGRDGNDATRIIVYYTDEGGQKVAHYFKKVS